MSITVIIADDQPIMRAALRTCLEAEPDLTVVGEAGDGETAVTLAGRLRPDVVVMDVRMPVMDGIEATRRIAHLADGPVVRVLVMTTFDVDEYIIDGLRAGASGFLVKDSTAEQLVQAVRVIAAGQAQLSPSVTRRLLDLHGGSLPRVRGSGREEALAGITPRQLAVLKLAARGLSNAEIGVALDLAPSSVKTHVRHLLARLGLTERVQLVVYAYEEELVLPGWRDAPGDENRDPPDAGVRRPPVRPAPPAS